MKIMPCPLNGPRNISEFAYGGEVTNLPAPDCDDENWIDYVYLENNTAGVVREWWYHTPTAYWFIAERDTRTDEILKTYPANEVFKDRVDFVKSSRPEPGSGPRGKPGPREPDKTPDQAAPVQYDTEGR